MSQELYAGEEGFRRVSDDLAERLHQIFPGEYEAFYTWAGRTWPIYGFAKSARTEQPR